MNLRLRLILLLISLAVSGCASILYDDYHQSVRVTSDPPGAKIYLHDTEIGVTPTFVEIRRGRSAQLTLLSRDGQKRTQHLDHNYRWATSGVANLIGGSVFPLPWVVDIITGTAWEFDPDMHVEFPETRKKIKEYRIPQKIAVAPPQGDFEIFSDDVGEYLEKHLRQKYPNAEILPYKKTLQIFSNYQYTFDHKADHRGRIPMFADLKATHILESTANVSDESVVVKYNFQDVMSEQLSETEVLTLPKKDFRTLQVSSFRRVLWESFDLVPNTISFDIARSWMQLDVGGEMGEHNANPQPITGPLGEVGRYLGTIGFQLVSGPKAQSHYHFRLHFVPDIQLTWQEVRFEYEPIRDREFRRFRINLGLGPQLDFETPMGVFYLNVLGSTGYTRVNWDDSSEQGMRLHYSGEVGYTRFLNVRTYFRLFSRVTAENESVWQRAFNRTANRPFSIDSLYQYYAGISLGVYFPEARNKVKSWY